MTAGLPGAPPSAAGPARGERHADLIERVTVALSPIDTVTMRYVDRAAARTTCGRSHLVLRGQQMPGRVLVTEAAPLTRWALTRLVGEADDLTVAAETGCLEETLP